MTKASLLFFLVCAIGIIDQTYGLGNYYWPNYVDSQDLANFAPLTAAIPPDCDKSKEGKEGSSESSSSSEESSSESKEGASSSSSEENKSNSEEGGEPSSKEGAKKEKEGSKEEKSGEASGEESKEKKREVHKKKKSRESKPVVHPHTYNFPSRQMERIVYSAASPYSYLPYRSSFVLQHPVASYPLKSSYQYLPSAAIVNPYRPQVVSRIVASPVTKIIYSTAALPTVSKTVVNPGAQVYSAPLSWSGPISYYKK